MLGSAAICLRALSLLWFDHSTTCVLSLPLQSWWVPSLCSLSSRPMCYLLYKTEASGLPSAWLPSFCSPVDKCSTISARFRTSQVMVMAVSATLPGDSKINLEWKPRLSQLYVCHTRSNALFLRAIILTSHRCRSLLYHYRTCVEGSTHARCQRTAVGCLHLGWCAVRYVQSAP